VNGRRVDVATLRRGDLVRLGDSLIVIDEAADGPSDDDPVLVGRAAGFRAAVALADRVAASSTPVLLLGETGTARTSSRAVSTRAAVGPARSSP